MKYPIITIAIYIALLLIAALRVYIFYFNQDPEITPTEIKLFTTEDLPIIKLFREDAQKKIKKYLPSPHAELLLGMTMGINNLSQVPKFKKMLVATSTIHVVVVSGYNINLVFELIMKVLKNPYKKSHFILAIFGTLLFALLSGFNSPVVRAWFMGTILSLGKFYGRRIAIIPVIIFTILCFIIVNPLYLTDLSFQLSTLAVLSLSLYSTKVESFLKMFVKADHQLLSDFCSTIAVQFLVTPLIVYNFGSFSLISPVVNALILWTVSISTVLGCLVVASSYVSELLAQTLSFLVYYPLDYFTFVIEFFSQFTFFILNLGLSLKLLLCYYIILLFITWRGHRC